MRNSGCERGARRARVKNGERRGRACQGGAANARCMEERAIGLIVQRCFGRRFRIGRGDRYAGVGGRKVEMRAGRGELQHKDCEDKPDHRPSAAGAQGAPQWLEARTVHGVKLHADGANAQTNPHCGPERAQFSGSCGSRLVRRSSLIASPMDHHRLMPRVSPLRIIWF